MEEDLDKDEEDTSDTQEQPIGNIKLELKKLQEEKKKCEWLAPWQWKKGQSGNPGGHHKGKSMKQYAREMIQDMTEDERQEFMKGLSKDTIWKMAEGNPDNKLEATITPLDQMLKEIRDENKEPLVKTNGEPTNIDGTTTDNRPNEKADGVPNVENKPLVLDKGQDGSEHKIQDELSPANPLQDSPLPERNSES